MDKSKWLIIGSLGAAVAYLAYRLFNKSQVAVNTEIDYMPNSSQATANSKYGNIGWNTFDELFKKYGKQYGVNPKWLKAIALNESSLGKNASVALGIQDPTNPKSVSYDGKSYGLMQLTIPTANDFEKVGMVELNDPEISIRLASKFLAWVITQFPLQAPDVLLKNVVMSYNQGVAGTKRGYTAALPYYEKFIKNLALVNSRDFW